MPNSQFSKSQQRTGPQSTKMTNKKSSYNSLSEAETTSLTKINSSGGSGGGGGGGGRRGENSNSSGGGGRESGAFRPGGRLGWLSKQCRLLLEDCSPFNIVVILLVLLLLGIVVFDEIRGSQDDGVDNTNNVSTADLTTMTTSFQVDGNINNTQQEEQQSEKIPMPSGVNFGSWLSLEDYFFASRSSVEVATPFGGKRVAACLPPLHTGLQSGPKWFSETDLLGNLTAMVDKTASSPGRGMAHAVSVFQAHRSSFVDLDADLSRLAAMGIKNIRVPMSWCWTDHDPRRVDLSNMTESQIAKRFTCKDPYFGEAVRWPAIPKALVEDFLRACSKYGLKAALDVHTLPGGTSIGTFSGVWPQWPRFWIDGDVPSTDFGKDNKVNLGHKLFSELIAWMEDLADRDPDAFDGLRGLSPMNEPAHLAGLYVFGGSKPDLEKNFLPPLPPDLAQDYLDELSTLAYSPTNSTPVPDGTHLRVFYWFKGALEIFRNSKLPSLGKQLHANIIESILAKELVPEDTGGDADGARRPAALKIIASWWCSESTTSPDERSDWAVLDTHHYHAWEKPCQGSVDGQDASYACGDVKRRNKVLDKCVQWSPTFREVVDQECGAGAQLMSAEFSASSHHSVRHACNDVTNLQESYVKQVEAAQEANVELFYWSYHMPYGGAFRRAWSFKHLMYLLGVLDQPDEPQFGCNDHVADVEEPNDDVFEPSS